jgi:hypothetical protein
LRVSISSAPAAKAAGSSEGSMRKVASTINSRKNYASHYAPAGGNGINGEAHFLALTPRLDIYVADTLNWWALKYHEEMMRKGMSDSVP